MNSYPQDFKKILGRWDSIAFIIAIVIGVGIFKTPSEVAKYLNWPYLILFAWLAGGIISLFGALCYAELSSSYPETGGNYIYLRQSYGKAIAFLFGWSELLVVRTGSIAAVAFIFSEYLTSFLSIDKYLIKQIAVSTIFILSIINIAGLRYGKRVQNVFTIAKIIALIAIIVLGITSKKGDFSHFYSLSVFSFDRGILPLFGLSLIPILWTYGGWHENTFVAGETRDARKTLPLALIRGVLIVTALYLAINFLYLYLMPINAIAQSHLIAADALQVLYGIYGRKALEALVVISSFGAINAMIITGSRITYALAKDNVIFRYIGKVDSRYGTPHRAIIINAVWSAILIIIGTFNKLLFFTGILVWLFFALAGSGLFILRYKFPNIDRPYKVWGYPLIPAVFVLICIALVINTMIFYTVQSLIGLGLLISGIPVYIISQKMKGRDKR